MSETNPRPAPYLVPVELPGQNTRIEGHTETNLRLRHKYNLSIGIELYLLALVIIRGAPQYPKHQFLKQQRHPPVTYVGTRLSLHWLYTFATSSHLLSKTRSPFSVLSVALLTYQLTVATRVSSSAI